MDVKRIHEILGACAGSVDSTGKPLPGTEIVDVWYDVALKPDKVHEHADEMANILQDWPAESWDAPVPALGKELIYLTVGGVLGSQTDALVLFAFGKLLDWWDVLEPGNMLGLAKDDPDGIRMAGMGMISIMGWRVAAKA